LTNAHVVEKASTVTVALQDQREFTSAIVGIDPDSDLAVLKIESDQQLPSAEMGNSDDIMIGESVIAIGNPFGFSHTVTTGVISAIDRSIKADDRVFHKFIQTDASINPGNSGGPLLNINGELIGLNTAIYAQAQGIGFAIPINRAKRIVADLINYGEVIQAWIGISVQPIDKNLAAYLGIQETNGLIVTAIEPDSPADNANLQEWDIILSIDDQKITDSKSYQLKIKDISVDQTVLFSIRRKGTTQQIKITAGLFPVELALDLADRLLGIGVTTIDDTTRSKYRIDADRGILITTLRRNSYLDRIGVRPGDIIHRINEKNIETIEDYKKAIVKYRNNNTVLMLIQRNRHLYNINVMMKDNKS
jgi:serine protease Do